MRTIVRSAQADEDLISIWQYVAEHDPVAADRLLDLIEQRWKQLVSFPMSGVTREDIAPGIRHLVVADYLVFHRTSVNDSRHPSRLHGRRRIDEGIVRRM